MGLEQKRNRGKIQWFAFFSDFYDIGFFYPNFPLKDRINHGGEPFSVLFHFFTKENMSILNNKHVVVPQSTGRPGT